MTFRRDANIQYSNCN